jgi:hypothetical protein
MVQPLGPFVSGSQLVEVRSSSVGRPSEPLLLMRCGEQPLPCLWPRDGVKKSKQVGPYERALEIVMLFVVPDITARRLE